MRKTILSAASALAIFAGSGAVLAQTQEAEPEMQSETTTEDLGVQEETTTGAGTGGTAAPDTGTGTTTGTGTDTTPGTTMGTDTGTTAAPVNLSELRPLNGEDEGVIVEGIPADEVIGGWLVNHEGERIADVNDLLVDSAGEPQGILAGFGGFLGFMQREVAVPLDRVQLVRGDDREFPTDLTEDEIEAMPEYEEPDA